MYHEREYYALRHAATLMDVTPLYKYDVKGRDAATLTEFISASGNDNPEAFQIRFEKLLMNQQRNLGLLEPTPIVSLSADAVMKMERE